MTELLNTLKKTSTPYEQSQMESLRLQMETMRQHMQQTQQQQNDAAQVSEQAQKTKKVQELKHYSPSPTIYAYGKAAACRDKGVKNAEEILKKSLNIKDEKQHAQKYEAPRVYTERFKPDQDFIYVPKESQTHIIAPMKGILGQTAYISSLDQTSEGLYREHHLTTQTAHDQTGQRANVGLEPLTPAYVVQEGDVAFCKTQMSKLTTVDQASGLIIKNIPRESTEFDPKQQYLDNFKKSHAEDTGSLRPHCGGSVFTRKIKEEEWREVPAAVAEMKNDTRTTMRTFHVIQSENAFLTSKQDRQTAKDMWHKDHTGRNPAAGIGADFKTTKQIDQEYVIEVLEKKMEKSLKNLQFSAKTAAIELYGVPEQDADKFVQNLSEAEHKQLMFLIDEAKRRQMLKMHEI